jgi:hypothetical protein
LDLKSRIRLVRHGAFPFTIAHSDFSLFWFFL